MILYEFGLWLAHFNAPATAEDVDTDGGASQ
jgi:hypothetical protein